MSFPLVFEHMFNTRDVIIACYLAVKISLNPVFHAENVINHFHSMDKTWYFMAENVIIYSSTLNKGHINEILLVVLVKRHFKKMLQSPIN